MMKLRVFTVLLLAGLAFAAPASKDDDEKITITKEYFPDEFAIYESKHEIVNIVIPLNSLNFDEDDSSEDEMNITIFFVEADIDTNGNRIYQGLYAFRNGTAKMILENGRDAASSGDDSRTVYLAATDGLYTYKADDQTAVKYGSLDDSIIGIDHVAEGDGLYILTKDHVVYEVKDNGNTKVKLDNVENAQQIMLDYSDNLYFYTPDKKAYVRTADGVIDIEGLPENPKKVKLWKPPFIIENGVPFLVDNVAYVIYSNGTSELSGFDFKPKAIPSAVGMEAMLIQYHAYNKKIYEYNILALLLGELLEELKNFLSDKTNEIQNLATNKRASLRRKA
ncbi:unnamed protein product [Leptosia nina]|uniref:Uncharacterized protein n=1 Tax=Leptosia nina TaxID=320188 RepID=A0AAV1JLK7_9NEOP